MTAKLCTPDRRINKLGRDLIQSMEQCRLEAYPDPMNRPPKGDGTPWTIGWGETGPDIFKGCVWTQDYADHRFELALRVREKGVAGLVKVPITDNAFAALVSFSYNAGLGERGLRGSTLLRMLNTGKPADDVAAELMKWIYAGGVKCNGLRVRRTLERALFLRPDQATD